MAEASGAGFEGACAATERAAAAAEQAAAALARSAKALRAAAAVGDSAKVRKLAESLSELGDGVGTAVGLAATSWTFSPAEEEQYLTERYAAELIAAAAVQGVRIDQVDNRLMAFPSLLRLLPSQSAVRIDAKRVTTLRPSTVVARLKAAQAAKPKLPPEKFIEVLSDAYMFVVGGPDNLSKGATLVDVYELLTLHPEMRKGYERTEFVRDVHLLDTSAVRQTKRGYEVRFPSATATRNTRNVLSIIGRDGAVHTYYGIRFQEVLG